MRLFLVVALAVLGACVNGGRPSPGLAEKYDVVIAWCERRLDSTQDYCDRVESSPADRIVANVLFGAAGGHHVAVEIEVVEGGSGVDRSRDEEVPVGRTWLHGVEISHDVCESPSCRLVARAYVDDELVLSDEFAFLAR